MTVCIAAICRGEEDKSYFVLCSDRRLGEGAWGADDAVTKIFGLGYNWTAMMAGDWYTAKEAALAIRKAIKDKGCPTDRAEIVQRVSDAAAQFADTILCRDACEFIIAGFIGQEPLMIRLGISPKEVPAVAVPQGCVVIGEGSIAASLMLKYRLYNSLRGMYEACYFIYEAKRFSELVSSVSRATVLSIHGPGESPPPGTKVHAALVNEAGLRHLDDLLERFSIRPAAGRIEPFPDSLFS